MSVTKQEQPLYFGRYQHFNGNIYTVIALARHSNTGEELVIYRREGGNQNGMIWALPKREFLSWMVADTENELNGFNIELE